MNGGIVAARYAHALLEYAREEHVEHGIYEAMFRLVAAISQVNEFMQALRNPSLPAYEKENLICNAAAGVPLQFRQFARLVVRHGREELLIYMACSFISLYRKEKDIVAVKLTTAVPVSCALEKRIELLIKAHGHAIIEIENVVDESIIGGFILEADFERFDASLSGALDSVRNKIVNSGSSLI